MPSYPNPIPIPSPSPSPSPSPIPIPSPSPSPSPSPNPNPNPNLYVASQVYGFASHVWFNLGHVLTIVAMRRPTASRGATLRAATVALLRGGIAKNRAAMASARTRPTRSPLPPLDISSRGPSLAWD